MLGLYVVREYEGKEGKIDAGNVSHVTIARNMLHIDASLKHETFCLMFQSFAVHVSSYQFGG